MFARVGAKMLFLVIAVALVFFGVGLIGFAIAVAFTPLVGRAWANAIAGAIFLLPPLLWAIIVMSTRPARPAMADNPGVRQITTAIFTALAKETPWVAVVGAGLLGVANLFLNRNKSRK